MAEFMEKNKLVAVFIAFLIIGLAVYANSFGNRFFWDDDDVIVKNIYVQNFQLDKFFSQNEIAGSFGQISNYWRPLLLISFAVDYKVWGLSPFGFHLTNTLLHVFAAWLVFILLYQLIELLFTWPTTPNPSLKRRGALLAFLPALFFLIHPLQTEAVTYVAGRGEPLSAVLSLLSLIFYLVFRTDGRKKFFFWALIFFAGGILVKEQTVYLPLIVLLIELVFFLKNFPQDIGKIVKNTAAFFALAAIYLAARLTILNFNHILSGSVNFVSAAYHQSIWQRAYTFCLAVWNYLRLLFVPTGLHMEWQITPVANFWSWPVIGLIFLGAAAIIIAVKTWKKNRLIAFGLSWFVLGLLPHANLIETNRPLYEHWLYLPMVGFWLAFFCLIFILFDKIKNERARDWSLKIFCVIVIAYVLFLTALTIARNRDWHDPITFYEKNLKYSPQSFIEHNNLGMAYAEAGRINEAIVQYRQAIAISDVYPQVHYNLANSLANAQKFAEAEKEYQNAIAMDPGFILPYQNLYNLYLYEGKKDEAKKILKEINLSK